MINNIDKHENNILASLFRSPNTFSLLEYQSNQLAQLTGESCGVGQELKNVLFLSNLEILKNVFALILKKINPKVSIYSTTLENFSTVDKNTNSDLMIVVIQHSTELNKFLDSSRNFLSNTIILAPQSLHLPSLDEMGVMAAVSLESDANIIQGAFIGALKGNKFILGFDRKEEENKCSNLTPRQKEVLNYICIGKSNKEIARDLNLSLSTVKVHCMAIFKELNVSNRTQAALILNDN